MALKAIAGRPKDLEDASTLLILHPELDTVEIRRRVLELATLAEAPELLSGFDMLVAAARPGAPFCAEPEAPASSPTPSVPRRTVRRQKRKR